MNKSVVLLKNLLLSTSQWNSLKYCKDKKKRGNIIGNSIGQAVLFVLLMVYCVANCIGYSKFGLTGAIPEMCATLIASLAFIFTFFKTNGYLFNFKEYDMLMSLPYKPKDIAACKFIYMYVKSLPWYISVSVSMLIGYAIYEKPGFAVYPVWIILSMIMPIIPMLAAAFLGFLVAKMGSGFKNKTIVQTIITVLFVFAMFGARFVLEDMFRNNKAEEVLNSLSSATDSAGKIYLPIEWFKGAVTELKISDMLLIIGISLVLFELVFIPVGRSYRKINSALKSHAASRAFIMTEQKEKSLLNTIAFKEFKRMTGSTVYLTNAGLGEIMCVVAGIAVLFLDIDKLLSKALMGAPITMEMIYPAIPFIIYFFIGMAATTAMTPSLEGKNYWIVQSLPIRKRTLYQGKMLFNMYLTVPCMLFATLAVCFSARVPLINTVLYVILGLVLCAFSTAWGCVCGIKHMRLDWENEIEVVKQGAAVSIYLLPNMFITMALIAGTVYLGQYINSLLITGLLIVVVGVLAGLSYAKVMALTKEE
jgi:ABC-2 type transport system permease protein